MLTVSYIEHLLAIAQARGTCVKTCLVCMGVGFLVQPHSKKSNVRKGNILVNWGASVIIIHVHTCSSCASAEAHRAASSPSSFPVPLVSKTAPSVSPLWRFSSTSRINCIIRTKRVTTSGSPAGYIHSTV